MYCPNCKKEAEGMFCTECGTKLIEKPIASGFNLNLGDANAISGGINTNITQFAAPKTELEILQDKKALYLKECKRAYEDNVLEQHEVIALESYRIELGLDKATADSILESVRIMTERNARKTSLNPIAKTKLKILTDNLMKNEVKALMDQIDGLEALVNRFDHDELSRKYFLVLAALKPERCISLKESSKIDSYWKSFWSYLAYISVGRIAEAENILMTLDRFTDYPEDNITVLAVAGALMNGNNAEAKEYLDSLTGEYSPALQRFVDSLYLLLEPEIAKEMDADEDSCAFYLVNFFNQKNSEINSSEQECTIPYSIDDTSGTFTGIVSSGLPIKGIFTADDGDTYEGEFVDGLPSKGVMSSPDGERFEGEFKNGNPYKGLMKFADGGTFEGEFNDDGMYNGTLVDFAVEDGATLTCKVVEGEFCGFGRMCYSEGGSFDGEFKAGQPYNGLLNEFIVDGNTLTGRYVNGQLEGFGSIRFEDGSRFEGEFKEGKPWKGKMFDMLMDDGQKIDAKISEGEPQMDDDSFWDLMESISETSDQGDEDQDISSFFLSEEDEKTEEESTIAYEFNDLSGTFRGIVEDGNPVKGIVTFDEGGTFEGEFNEGQPFNGTLTDAPYDEDSTITAKIIDGKPEGDVILNFTDGHRFEGELDNGEIYNGMMFDYIMKDGSVVDSKVINGKIQAVEEAERKEAELARQKAEEEARLKAEQEALRNKITYTLFVTSVTDPIQAMMIARSTFGWNVGEYREKTAKLPIVVSTSEDLKTIQELESTLLGGYNTEVTAKNALGEEVELTAKSKNTSNKTTRKR